MPNFIIDNTPSAGADLQNVASINGGQLAGLRNKIIGGDFTVNPWQRGAAFTAPANGAYTADRWAIGHSMDGVVNVLKTNDGPIGATQCLHVNVTTADASIAAGQLCVVQQRIEGFNVGDLAFGQAGTRFFTLSFWHKHTKTGTYCVAFRNSAADRSYVAEYTQDASDTWEEASVTVPVDTSGVWLYDSGIGLNVTWALATGSTFQTTANAWQAGSFLGTANQVNALDSTANNFKLALVRLEPGSASTRFEARPYGMELALCQRYYWRTGDTVQRFVAMCWAENTSRGQPFIRFPVPMRALPTGGSSTITAFFLRGSGSNVTVSTSAGWVAQSTELMTNEITATGAHGASIGGCVILVSPASAWHIEASAEL